VPPLAELVEIVHDGDLPTVADLDPYRLGATASVVGTSQTYGENDPYVARSFRDVDTRLAAALGGSRMVLVVGPSKAGKTRTCYEALRSGWPDARLLTPQPGAFEQLLSHPRLQTSTDTLVVWLDDLERYLTQARPLTPSSCARLTSRPGATIVVATMRAEARDRLAATDTGDLTRDTRLLLEQAHTIELLPTSDSADEQAAAATAYPDRDLRSGLAAVLAGAPELLRGYDAARHNDPLMHAVIGVVIDWARVGRPDPIPEPLLKTLAADRLWDTRPDLETNDEAAQTAVRAARTPPESAGLVAALATHPLADRVRGYRPFDYLVAADDGQRSPPRPVPDTLWLVALEDADKDTAFAVGVAAYTRGNIERALDAYKKAAAAGHAGAMFSVGVLFAHHLNPPDLPAARRWYEQAAAAGDTEAMYNLGYLIGDQLHAPGAPAARRWWEQAAAAGHTNAMYSLGIVLSDLLQPPDLAAARRWYEQAAAAGHVEAMNNLGILLARRLNPPDLAAARRWYEQAAAAGHVEAMIGLGVLLMERLKPPDLPAARHWFQHAAETGHPMAMNNLGVLLADRLNPPNLDAACLWYEQAAAAGNVEAMTNLGLLLAYRLNPPNLDGARHWFEQAVAAGHPDAILSLQLLRAELNPP
jgi:TPR repeat protein